MRLTLLEFVRLALKHKSYPFYHYYLKNRKCLDVACGLGELLERDPINFVGIELDEKLLADCKKKGLNVFQGSCTNLGMFRDESFDAVSCFNIIEHLYPMDASKMIDECARVLKRGGVILIDTPSETYVWDTFSHVKPYPPIAFHKLINNKLENYIKPSTDDKLTNVTNLTIEKVYYKGLTRTRVTLFLYLVIFNFTSLRNMFRRPPFCSGYLIVLRKK